jgi:predicted RNA binding protein YcfA (HicA-like mRNA interferase family)
MTAREVINRLRREGWADRQGKGSHTIFSKDGHNAIVVSNHRGDLPIGTLRAIVREAGWEWPPHA